MFILRLNHSYCIVLIHLYLAVVAGQKAYSAGVIC